MRYTILEEESGMHQVNSSFVRAISNHEKIVGKASKNWMFYRKGDRFKWAFELEEMIEVGETVLEKVVNDKEFIDQIISNIRRYSLELSGFSNKLAHMDLKVKSNQELASIFRKYSDILEQTYTWGVLIEMMEVYNSLFSKFVRGEIAEIVEKKGLGRAVDEYLAVLVTPREDSAVRKEEKEFLGIISDIQSDPEMLEIFENSDINGIKSRIKGTKLEKDIAAHLDKYCWVNYYYEGPEMDMNYLVDLLTHATRTMNPKQKLDEMASKDASNIRSQETLLSELGPSKFVERLILAAREFATLKIIRKDSTFFGSYASDKLKKEICRRFDMTLNQCRCMNDIELLTLLEEGRIDKDELSRREEEIAQLIEDGKERIITGKEAFEASKNIISIEVKDVKEIVGTCASPGKATGKVKLIMHVEDMSDMNEGDILVANATNPSFVPAMKKAAAIVTDMGGITCHAAIVSREFGVPCVVGTKVATKMLKDGDEVEVDAVAGTVKIIKKS